MLLARCEIKNMRPIFKSEMLIYLSKANLDEKILFGKVTHHLDPEIRKMLVSLGARIPHSVLVCDLLAIEIETLFLKLVIYTSMPHKSWTRMECGILDSHTDPLQAFF